MTRIFFVLLSACWAVCLAAQTIVTSESDPDVIEFALITDTHGYGPTADFRSSETNVRTFVDYCRTHPELSFALYGGDFFNSYETDHEQALWCLRSAREDFAPLTIPFYTTPGDHDVNGKQKKADGTPDNSQIVTNEEYYQLFSPLSPTNPHYHPEGIVCDPAWPHGNYYYRDFERQKFRLIVLNNYCLDSLETYGYHGQEMKWLCETAMDFSTKERPEDWCFLLLGHAFSINMRKNPISRLLHAYVRGNDFRDTDYGVHYEGRFGSARRARLVGIVCGHFHEDLYSNLDGYNEIRTYRGFATAGDMGQPSEVCFDHFVLNTRTCTLEQRRIGGSLSHTYTYDKADMTAPALTYPGIQGLGKYTNGGHGGRILHVTNTDDSGLGSLRWAVEQSGARIVVFDTSGTIHLKSPLIIERDSISILGQSAPGEGITLAGSPVVVRASEAVVRYLTLLDGMTDGDFGQKQLVLNHLTLSSDHGDALTLRHACQVTVSHCLITHAGPGCAGIVAGGCLVSYFFNRVVDCPTAIRLPNEEGCNHAIQLSRNVFENWHDHCIIGGGCQGEFTFDENLAIPGPLTTNRQLLEVATDGTGRYFVQHNRMVGREDCDAHNDRMVTDHAGLPYIEDPAGEATRQRMHPYARPHEVAFAKSCLTEAAFQSHYLAGQLTWANLRSSTARLAGSGYRPEPACPDSLLTGDVEGYLARIVHPERTIILLFENDVRCAIDRYPTLAALKDVLPHDSATVGIVTTGNFLQGGMQSAITQGRIITDIMRTIGYDAIGLANHEFDYDVTHMRHLLGEMSGAVTCVNLRDTQTDSLVFAPYVMRRYDRRKVAFVGLCSPSIAVINSFGLQEADGSQRYKLLTDSLYARVQQAVDAARQDGADYVVALAHLHDANPSIATDTRSLIAATTGIDVVLDGGAGSSMMDHVKARDGREVLLAQTAPILEQIGKLTIDPDGRIRCDFLTTDNIQYQDPQAFLFVDSVSNVIAQTADVRVGQALVALSTPSANAPGADATDVGDLTADAMRSATATQIAWINGGSINKGLKAGVITRGDVYGMLPYKNNLTTLDMTGADIVRALSGLLGDFVAGRSSILPISGAHVVADGQDGHVLRIDVLDETLGIYRPIDPEATYTVCTTDFCLSRMVHHKYVDSDIKSKPTGISYSNAMIRHITDRLGGTVKRSADTARIVVLPAE